jgi:hypothetical protein
MPQCNATARKNLSNKIKSKEISSPLPDAVQGRAGTRFSLAMDVLASPRLPPNGGSRLRLSERTSEE